MIDRVRITRFGLFVNRDFELAPVTVFVGPNETGKTTVFDALVAGLCTVSETTGYGRDVRERYGDRTQRVVVLDPEPADRPDVVEFLNVQAIRSGDVSLVITGKNWIDRLRKSLFTSGLNPTSIAEELRKDARRKVKDAKKDEEQRATVLRRLAELKESRQAVLDRRAALAKDAARLSALGGEIEALRQEIDRVEAALELQRRYNDRRRTVGILEAIARRRKLEEELEKLAAFARDWSEEIVAGRHAVTETNGEAATAEAEAGVQREQADRLTEHADRAEEGAREAEKLGRRLAELQARLGQAPAPESRTRTSWSGGLLAASGVLFVAGGIAAVVLGGTAGLVALTMGLAAAAVLGVLARRQVLEQDSSKRDRFAEACRAELEALLRKPLGAVGIEGLTAETASARAEASATVDAAREARRQADEARRQRDDAIAAVEQARAKALHAASELRQLFQAIGVADEAELGAKRTLVAERRRTLEETVATVSAAQTEHDQASVDALETLLRARLAELEKSIDEPEVSPYAARRLEPELANKQEALQAKAKEERALAERLSGDRGELRATLGKLPEQIAGEEEMAAKLDAGRAAADVEAQACEKAAVVFDDVARDTRGTIQQLAREATARLATLVAETGRAVEIGKLEDPETFVATDAGGTARPLEHLSRGTRDALLFSVRLALAEKLGGPVRMLLLDEPFGALDPKRVQGLLSVLDNFHKRTGYQLVFFTKEPALAAAVQAAFADSRVHRLD